MLNDGQSFIPTLHQALQTCAPTPVIIDIKAKDCAKELCAVLSEFPKLDVTVASFNFGTLRELRETRDNEKYTHYFKIYALEGTKPVETIHRIKKARFDGIGINFWLLNPLTNLLIRRANLEAYAFTVNSRIMAKFIQLLYPRVAICSDRPELFIKHPWLKVRTGPAFKPTRLNKQHSILRYDRTKITKD